MIYTDSDYPEYYYEMRYCVACEHIRGGKSTDDYHHKPCEECLKTGVPGRTKPHFKPRLMLDNDKHKAPQYRNGKPYTPPRHRRRRFEHTL